MNHLLKLKAIAFLFCACCLSINLSAQDETLFEKVNFKLTGAWGGPHTIFSGFQEDNSFSNGGFGGLEFGKAFFIGWGSYNMQTKLVLDGIDNQDYELNYNGLHLGYAYNPAAVIHPTVSVMLGPGSTKVNGAKDDNIFVIQPALGAEVNLFRWFRINLRAGYRAALDSDANAQVSNEDLSSFFGGIDFKFGWSWGSDPEKDGEKMR